MRNKTVELTMINDVVYFVPAEELNSMGVADSPESFIGNYIRGSRGGMLRVYRTEDFTGASEFINPQMIVSMKVTY